MYSVESNATSSPRVESAHSAITDQMAHFIRGRGPCGERTVFMPGYAPSVQDPAESLIAASYVPGHVLPSSSI